MLSAPVARYAPAYRTLARTYSGLSRRLRHELTGAGVAMTVLLAVFGRFVVPGVVGQQRDTGAFYYPLTAWLAQELAAGRFPLWCPLIFAGYPLVADGEIGLLYLPNIVALLLLPVDIAFVLIRTAHYLLAAAGLYGLARVLGVGRAGSVFGGVVFALGGFMLGHLDHGNILRSAAWLPVMLGCADLALRAADQRRWFWLAGGAAALAMSGLGLHPQILLINLVALGLWVGARALALVSWQRSWRGSLQSVAVLTGRGAIVVVIVTSVGLAGAAVQLLPTYELGIASSRGDGLTYAQAAAGGLAPVDFLTLLLPYGFRADPAVQWMRYPYWESTVYIGVGGLLLALLGLVSGLIGGQRRVVLPVAAVGVGGLLLAMADHAPVHLYSWLWWLPGFSSMRAPVRYTLIVELMLALLAAIGLDRLRHAPRAGSVRLAAVAAALAVVVSVVAGVLLRDWLLAEPRAALATIEQVYLTLPRDRAALAATSVRDGLLATLALDNRWTGLAITSGAVTAALLGLWAGFGRRFGEHFGRLAGIVAAVGLAELLVVAHGFHPTVPRDQLREQSRQMRFLSQQPGHWRTLLAGRTDLSVTSRPVLSGVAQAYGYSSLPTTRTERYWTRVNEVDDDLLDLWNIRYLVEAKGSAPRGQVEGVLLDPDRPLIDGPAGNPLGDEVFLVAPTPGNAIRIVGSLSHAGDVVQGEPVAEVLVFGPGVAPVTLTVRAGEHLSEAAYDEATSPLAHRKATVGQRWEPRDPAGRVYPRDLYVADLRLPAATAPMTVERIEVRAVLRAGSLRLTGLGIVDNGAVKSVLPHHRAKYALAYETDTALIFENRDARPRAYLAATAVQVAPDDWSLVRMTDEPMNLANTVLIEDADLGSLPTAVASASSGTAATTLPLRASETAEITEYRPDQVMVRVRTDAARYLVLTDSYFPGWHAAIDGRPVEIKRANYLFRAVQVPPGEHTVVWQYRPPSLLVGGAISLSAVVALALLATCGLRRRAPTWRDGTALPRPQPAPDTRECHRQTGGRRAAVADASAAPPGRPAITAGRPRSARGAAACSGAVAASPSQPTPSLPSSH